MKKYFIAMMAAMLLSLPTWVKTVKANDLNDQQLDAVTGATPLTEASTYTKAIRKSSNNDTIVK